MKFLLSYDANSDGTTDFYYPDVISAQDYYAGGMLMPGRLFNAADYRNGFNGKEKDDELKGSGNSYDFGARIYDSILGRYLSVDPVQSSFPDYSP